MNIQPKGFLAQRLQLDENSLFDVIGHLRWVSAAWPKRQDREDQVQGLNDVRLVLMQQGYLIQKRSIFIFNTV